jgi:selenocysteine lyase/cysteine desulfurase
MPEQAWGVAPDVPSVSVLPLLPVAGSSTTTPLVTGETVRYVGLDVAATGPALTAVVDQVNATLPYYGSVHRGAGAASQISTDLYESARRGIGRFVGARDEDVVVITRNTTDALTLLAHCLPQGSSVVHLDVEHHANVLPWRAHEARVVLSRATVEETLVAIDEELTRHPTTLLAVTGASNVTGDVPPLRRLADLAHARGARIVVDAAQLAPHRRIDLVDLDVDYVAISGHKLYAPFGAGALIGRRDWLDVAPAYLPGGGSVREVSLSGVSWTAAPARHEGGTPNLLGAVALAASCRALSALGTHELEDHERALLLRLDAGLDAIPGVRRLRLWPDAPDRVAVASFTVDGLDSGLVAAALSAEHGVGVRDGRFCAHPLLARIAPEGSAVRASIGVATGSDDVDRLLHALAGLVADGPGWAYERTAVGWAPTPDPRDLDPFGLRHEALEPDPGCVVPEPLAS